MDASPCPPRAPDIETQVASVAIDQVQSRAAVTAIAPCPPVAVKADGALLAVTWHLSAVGALTDVWVELQPEKRQASATEAIDTSARIRQRMRSPGVDRSQAAGQRYSRKR